MRISNHISKSSEIIIRAVSDIEAQRMLCQEGDSPESLLEVYKIALEKINNERIDFINSHEEYKSFKERVWPTFLQELQNLFNIHLNNDYLSDIKEIALKAFDSLQAITSKFGDEEKIKQLGLYLTPAQELLIRDNHEQLNATQYKDFLNKNLEIKKESENLKTDKIRVQKLIKDYLSPDDKAGGDVDIIFRNSDDLKSFIKYIPLIFNEQKISLIMPSKKIVIIEKGHKDLCREDSDSLENKWHENYSHIHLALMVNGKMLKKKITLILAW